MPAETTQQDQYGSGSDPRARRDEHDEYHLKSSRENVCVFPPPGWSGLGRSVAPLLRARIGVATPGSGGWAAQGGQARRFKGPARKGWLEPG